MEVNYAQRYRSRGGEVDQVWQPSPEEDILQRSQLLAEQYSIRCNNKRVFVAGVGDIRTRGETAVLKEDGGGHVRAFLWRRYELQTTSYLIGGSPPGCTLGLQASKGQIGRG